MERYIVKVKVELDNYEEFDKKLIKLLEDNTADYDLSVIKVMTKKEKKELVDSIRKVIKDKPKRPKLFQVIDQYGNIK